MPLQWTPPILSPQNQVQRSLQPLQAGGILPSCAPYKKLAPTNIYYSVMTQLMQRYGCQGLAYLYLQIAPITQFQPIPLKSTLFKPMLDLSKALIFQFV